MSTGIPHQFFDVTDTAATARGHLPDFETARKGLFETLPDVTRNGLPKNGDRRDTIIGVRDEIGRMLFMATLSLVARPIARTD